MKPIDMNEHVREFEENGYTIFENVINLELVARLIETIIRLENEQGIGPGMPVPDDNPHRARFEAGSSRLRSLIMRDPVFREAAINPIVMEFCERVLGKDFLLGTGVASFTLNPKSDLVNPATQAQPLHTDDYYIPIPRPHAPLAINALWALSDFRPENGATRFVPGSHAFDRSPQYEVYTEDPSGASLKEQANTVPVVMPKGSIFIQHASMWHGGGANMTEERRYCMSAYYIQGWIRPQDNLLMEIPLDMIRDYDPQLQAMLGVRGRYKNYVGHIHHKDPAVVLFGG